jgi:hypothetical protein
MKYCPTCGKQLQYDTAEICTGCGCRVIESQKGGGVIGVDKIIAFFLVAIFIVLCIIALSIISFSPHPSANVTVMVPSSAPATNPEDNSLSVGWNTMDDWSDWDHTATWSGKIVGPCNEFGPRVVDRHGEYGTEVSLIGGSTESGIWRTFSDHSGEGWNTLTLVGRLSESDVPSGRWMKIDVDNNEVYSADVTRVPPGNGILFTIPVHFAQSKNVKVKISSGQKPAWGGQPFKMEFYSLRLSLEKNAGT